MTRFGPVTAAVAAVACAAATQVSLPVFVTVIAAIPLVFLLPGYTLLEALGSETIGGAQRLVLVPALSIAVDVVVALIVNFVPSGLTARSWAIGLACAVVIAAAVAVVRGGGAPRGERPRTRTRLRPLDVVSIAVAAAVLAGAIVLARTPLAADRAQGYTILSLVRGHGSTVDVDVQSGELRSTRYRLVVAGNHAVYRRVAFRLDPGARVATTIPVSGVRGPVEAWLYVAGRPQPYRHVFLR